MRYLLPFFLCLLMALPAAYATVLGVNGGDIVLTFVGFLCIVAAAVLMYSIIQEAV